MYDSERKSIVEVIKRHNIQQSDILEPLIEAMDEKLTAWLTVRHFEFANDKDDQHDKETTKVKIYVMYRNWPFVDRIILTCDICGINPIYVRDYL